MALSPIQIFQDNSNSLSQILQGGNQTITGIFDRAIQIGRDLANNQSKNETEMLAMRQNETALAQRRAENLQQNNEDAMRFSRNAFESDRRFDASQQQLDFSNKRTTANDIFGNVMDEKRYQLSADAGKRSQQQLDDATTARETEARDAAARRANLEQLYGQAAQDSPTNHVVSGIQNGVGPPANLLTEGDKQNAISLASDPRVDPLSRKVAVGRLGLGGGSGDQEGESTADRSLAYRQRRDAEKDAAAADKVAAAEADKARAIQGGKVASYINADFGAFPNPNEWMPRNAKTAVTNDKNDKPVFDPSKLSTAHQAELSAYNSDPNAYWTSKALEYKTADAFANAETGTTEVQKQRRRELWEYAQGNTSAPAATASDDPQVDANRKKLIDLTPR